MLFDLSIDSGLLALINTLNACWGNLFILFQRCTYHIILLDNFYTLITYNIFKILSDPYIIQNKFHFYAKFLVIGIIADIIVNVHF